MVRSRKYLAGIVTSITLFGSMLMAIPAEAAQAPRPDPKVSPASASSNATVVLRDAQRLTSFITNSSCVSQIRAAQAQGATHLSHLSTDICTVSNVVERSAALPLTGSGLAQAKSTMTASEYSSLVAAAAAGTIYYTQYSQTISQITDQERQYGTFYFNGSKAWVTVTYAGYTGDHRCTLDYAAGYGVSLTDCSDNAWGSGRSERMSWIMSPLGLPISWTETYEARLAANGGISYQ